MLLLLLSLLLLYFYYYIIIIARALGVSGRVLLCAPATATCRERQGLFVTAVPLFTARPHGGQPGYLSFM
jgi:hypothetical protein